jgi:hypothetical protein
MQRDRFSAEQRRCHAWQRGILSAAYRDATTQRPTAGYSKLVHD